MKILVTGKQGQLGYAFKELSENHSELTWKFTDRSELDITDSTNIQSVVKNFHPDWIINAAAYTDVDGAENNEKLAFNPSFIFVIPYIITNFFPIWLILSSKNIIFLSNYIPRNS